MWLPLLVALWLGQSSQRLPFNNYQTFLEPRDGEDACHLNKPVYFQNRTYRFRGTAYPGDLAVPLRQGQFEERNELGGIEWSMALERQESIILGTERATLVRFFADHLAGTGSASHVLVMRCNGSRLEVVFEAEGEGVRAVYLPHSTLTISAPFWRREDSHASPSEVIHEEYRWDPSGHRFVLAHRGQRRRR